MNYKSTRLDKKQLETVRNLLRVIESAQDVNKAIKLFAEIDEDSSGKLDRNEFQNLIDSLGLEITDEAFDVNSIYDIILMIL